MTLDAVGPVPPIAESHVEMDGAWALYETWVKFQMGVIDTALVYSYGKPSPGSLQDVLSTQLDPYYVAPLWPDAHSVAALQARLLLEQGIFTPDELADCAVRTGTAENREDYFSQPLLSDPLREADCPTYADGGVALILASEEKADELCDRPAWITGIDHQNRCTPLAQETSLRFLQFGLPPRTQAYTMALLTPLNYMLRIQPMISAKKRNGIRYTRSPSTVVPYPS